MDLFSDLTKLEKARSGWHAFGFYLAYLCLGLLLAAFAGGVSEFFIKASTFREGFTAGTKFGHFTAVVFCPLVSFLILRAKLNYTFAAIALAVVSGLLALAIGMVGDLIPSAILSCFKKNRQLPGWHPKNNFPVWLLQTPNRKIQSCATKPRAFPEPSTGPRFLENPGRPYFQGMQTLFVRHFPFALNLFLHY